jgi:hypothetical protein
MVLLAFYSVLYCDIVHFSLESSIIESAKLTPTTSEPTTPESRRTQNKKLAENDRTAVP